MNQHEQQVAAKAFVERWRDRGDEKQDTQTFWTDLLVNVLGVPATQIPSFVSFERKVRGGYIDVFMEDAGVLVEQKGLAVDLDRPAQQSDGAILTPFEQAVRYKARLADPIKPRWIVTSNFKTIRVYDQHEDVTERHPQVIELEDLADEYWRLGFITDKSNSRIERERRLSVEAGEIVANLYGRLSKLYRNLDADPREQESLNVLVVRLVFLLFAEDAGLLQKHDAFRDYLTPIPADQLRQALIDLFKVLDTPEDERDPYLPDSLLAFPYVNGGVFADESIVIPRLDDNVKLGVFEAADFDWRLISPTIFGAVFESTLNPETRRQGGMHYTSVENIHKVIDPLFLDDLRSELESIEALKTEKARVGRLRAFQRKLGSITVLDPACGSGNFLTESYLSLRRLENRALSGILGDQMGFRLEGELDPIHVTLDQFYGIEINDFAVAVARTALWIAEFQMKGETQEILWQYGDQLIDELPLTSNPHVVEGNALRMDWNDVVPTERCNYICGNPPFVGGMQMDKSQKQDIRDVFKDRSSKVGELDYVTAWYIKAVDYASDEETRIAFVSTNSITQGLSVGILWSLISETYGYEIEFAYRTFVWDSEAASKAHVHVVIIGLCKRGTSSQKKIYLSDGTIIRASHINGYLLPMRDVYVYERSLPISDVPRIRFGSMPRGKGFTLTPEQRNELIEKNPMSKKWIRPYWGANEFLNGKERYCLWLVDADDAEIAQCPLVLKRIEQVRNERLSSKAAATRKLATTPKLFAQIAQPTGKGTYLLIPRTTSERRPYIPIALVSNEVIASDLAYLAPDAHLYHFGVLSSQFHNAWVRTVAGRLKSDYRYAKDLVYNTFVWPSPDSLQRTAIEECAKCVLEIRKNYPNQTIGNLYKPETMPEPLQSAHAELDAAVEAAYGVSYDRDEERIVSYLFSLYKHATQR